MNNAERIARMSPEKAAEYKASWEKAVWVGSLRGDQLRSYMWKETQEKLGCTYDQLDADLAVFMLREETFRLMTAETAVKAIVPRHVIRKYLAERHPVFNHFRLSGVMSDSLVRLYGRGILFAAFDSFSNNPTHGADPAILESYDVRLAQLKQMEADHGHLSL